MKRITLLEDLKQDHKSAAVIDTLKPYHSYRVYASVISFNPDRYSAIIKKGKRKLYVYICGSRFEIENA